MVDLAVDFGCRGCVVERGGYSSRRMVIGQVTECVIFVDVVDLLFLVGRRSASLRTFVARREVVRCPSVQHHNMTTLIHHVVRLAHFSYPLALLGCGLGAGPRWPRSSGIARRAAPTPVLCPARGCFTLQTCLQTVLCGVNAHCRSLTEPTIDQLCCMQSINRNKTPTQLRTCGANNPAKPA